MAGSTPASATGLAINGFRMCFISAKPLFKYHLVDPNPQLMCGELDDIIEVLTPGIEHHGWRVLLQPHPGELDILIPLIGFSESPTDTWTPTDTLTSFTTLVRLKSSTANAVSTTSCVIDKAVFRGQKGLNPISLQLDILGKTSTETATFNPTSVTHNAPYPFTAGTLTLAGTARAYDSFVLVHDNNIRKRFNNSVTADVLQNVRRTIHLGVSIPYTDDEDDLFTSNIVGTTRAAGFAANLAYSRSNYNLAWDFTKVTWEAEPPPIEGKESEVRSFMWMAARKSGSNVLCTITQDNTG